MPVVVPEIEKAEGARRSAPREEAGRARAAASDAAGPGHAVAAAADALLRRHGPQRRPQGRVDAAAGRARCGPRLRRRRSPRRRLRKTTSSSRGPRRRACPSRCTREPRGRGTPGGAARPGRESAGTGCAPRRQAAPPAAPPEDVDEDARPAAAGRARQRRGPPPAPLETPPVAPGRCRRQRPPRLARSPSQRRPLPLRQPAPPLLNSRSLTGFPSATVGYSIYEVAPPQQAAPPPLQPGEVPALPRRVTPTPVVDDELARCEGRFRNGAVLRHQNRRDRRHRRRKRAVTGGVPVAHRYLPAEGRRPRWRRSPARAPSA